MAHVFFISLQTSLELKKEVVVSHVSLKGMEHVPNIFMSFDKYLFLEVINILI